MVQNVLKRSLNERKWLEIVPDDQKWSVNGPTWLKMTLWPKIVLMGKSRPKMLQIGAKWSAIWSQMDQNGPKQPEMAGKVLKWSKKDRNGPKCSEMVPNGIKQHGMVHNGPIRPKIAGKDLNGLIWSGPMVGGQGYSGRPVLDPKTPQNGSFKKCSVSVVFTFWLDFQGSSTTRNRVITKWAVRIH